MCPHRKHQHQGIRLGRLAGAQATRSAFRCRGRDMFLQRLQVWTAVNDNDSDKTRVARRRSRSGHRDGSLQLVIPATARPPLRSHVSRSTSSATPVTPVQSGSSLTYEEINILHLQLSGCSELTSFLALTLPE